MGYVGKETALLSKEKATKNYDFLRSTQLYFALQNAWTQPNSDVYCAKLFKEVPAAKEAVQGKLAVVTGVTIGGAGYHMAQELALSAGMSVIIMGRNSAKLVAAEEAIKKEAIKRKCDEPTLYHVSFDLDDLTTAVSAAEETIKIAKDKYDGKLHILVNNAGAAVPDYRLTKQGVEANVGRNFLAPHLLTEKLLPLLEKASTSTYKPRCVFIASLGYCLSLDFDSDLLLKEPKFGGAPEGYYTFDEDGKCTNDALSLGLMYGRGKHGDVAAAVHMAKKYPKVNFTSQQPGSIVSNFGNSLGLLGTVYYYGFWLFQYSASQGAVTALRCALDPDFNTVEDLQGAYMHADSNPWPVDDLKIEDPDTKKPYEWDKYSEKVYTNANTLIEKLLK